MHNQQTHQINSTDLQIAINLKGAELNSVIDKKTGFEFIWQADATIWNRHAPVLFPIVGKLFENKVLIDGKNYDSNFELCEIYEDLVRFMLESNEESFNIFPFEYKFFISYQIKNNELKITYTVKNTGFKTLYFSVGAHPGFNIPNKNLSDCEIRFEKEENLKRYLLNSGNFNGLQENLGENTNVLPLSSKIFEKDAIVFKNLHSNNLTLVQKNSNFKIEVDFKGFPYMGIWSKFPNQDFICLEPWLGLADHIDFKGDISEKEGIICLESSEQKEFSYQLKFTAP